jgi:NAD(P)-dependent dehydrogenase (short-subunit alcohol dehydrogenase family)
VTGGGTGIGKAIAIKLAADGYQVAIAARRPGPLAEVSKAIGGSAYQCDIREASEIYQLVDTILADFGRLDALVNNAGIAFQKKAEDVTLEEVDRVVQTNLVGTILLSQRCIGPLRETKGAIHRQYQLDTRATPPADPGHLRSQQGGHRSFFARAGTGVGLGGRAGKCRKPGDYSNRHTVDHRS